MLLIYTPLPLPQQLYCGALSWICNKLNDKNWKSSVLHTISNQYRKSFERNIHEECILLYTNNKTKQYLPRSTCSSSVVYFRNLVHASLSRNLVTWLDLTGLDMLLRRFSATDHHSISTLQLPKCRLIWWQYFKIVSSNAYEVKKVKFTANRPSNMSSSWINSSCLGSKWSLGRQCSTV